MWSNTCCLNLKLVWLTRVLLVLARVSYSFSCTFNCNISPAPFRVSNNKSLVTQQPKLPEKASQGDKPHSFSFHNSSTPLGYRFLPWQAPSLYSHRAMWNCPRQHALLNILCNYHLKCEEKVSSSVKVEGGGETRRRCAISFWFLKVSMFSKRPQSWMISFDSL